MNGKLKCSILGATGVVGQNYIKLLQGHPWFEIVDLAASPRSAGKPFTTAVKDKWQMDIPIPGELSDIIVRDVQDVDSIPEDISFVFSAINMPKKDDIKAVESAHAKNGFPVVSNNSAHRWTPDVPMLIPEINHHHLDVIPAQQRANGYEKGFIVVKPNCSLQSYLTPVFALEQVGFKVKALVITTMQAVSGAGYPGVPSLDMIDNIVPYIGGEEEKTEKEPGKILGHVDGGKIVNDESIAISATCTRVPVIDGHTASVAVQFAGRVPAIDEILDTWKRFTSVPQKLGLPFAPVQPIMYLDNDNRPQPRKDRDNDKGMAVTVGRLREDPVFHIKFIGLSHNTVRGAAGGGILNAELLKARGYLD